jgi:hypothetical protein
MGYDTTKAWRERQDPEFLRAYRAEEARKWRAAHPEKVKEIRARHRDKNLDRIRELDRVARQRRRKADPEGARRRTAKFKAKRLAEREALAGRAKPDVCELCQEGTHSIVWDHCHVHGHFRGWICDRCNKVLGLAHDSPDLLRQMATYLEQGVPQTSEAPKAA